MPCDLTYGRSCLQAIGKEAADQEAAAAQATELMAVSSSSTQISSVELLAVRHIDGLKASKRRAAAERKMQAALFAENKIRFVSDLLRPCEDENARHNVGHSST